LEGCLWNEARLSMPEAWAAQSYTES